MQACQAICSSVLKLVCTLICARVLTALQAVRDPQTGLVGFNLEVGGYFSPKRNVVSIPMDTFLTQEQVVPFCKALLEVFRCEMRDVAMAGHHCGC